jgi:uncharacterized protein (TIGR02118 family)
VAHAILAELQACDGRNPMASLVVMYKTPTDAAAFDKYYFEKHLPIAKKIPGLRKYEVSRGAVAKPEGPSGFHLVATLRFDNLAAIRHAFASPEGQIASADVGNFASGGVELYMFEDQEV